MNKILMPRVVVYALPLGSSHGVHCNVQPSLSLSLSAHYAASPNCHCLPGGNEARVTCGARDTNGISKLPLFQLILPYQE